MPVHIPSLLVVLAAAVVAPLMAEGTRRMGLSLVVLELLLGVAIGPQGLGWARVEGIVPGLAHLGMAFLFFLAGLEIDLHGIRGEPLARSLVLWVIYLGLGCLVALGLRAAGLLESWLIVAIALATTALGILVPILKDSGMLATAFGRYVLGTGVTGELAPILVMSLALSTQHTTGLQLVFMVITVATAWLLVEGSRFPAFLEVLSRTMTQSSQLPVRIAILLVGALAVLAEAFGLDLALGALAAGMVVGLATRVHHAHVLHHKLEAIGFGFLVPGFFIVSGMKLDVVSLLRGMSGLLVAGIFLLALPVVRAPVMILAPHSMGREKIVALGLYLATTLSLVVALTEIGVSNGLMRPAEAAPLVSGSLLGVVLFPMIANRLTSPATRPGHHARLIFVTTSRSAGCVVRTESR